MNEYPKRWDVTTKIAAALEDAGLVDSGLDGIKAQEIIQSYLSSSLLCNTCLQPIAPEDGQFHFHASHFNPVFRGEVATKELKNDVMALPVERVHKNLPDGGYTDKPYVELNSVMDLLMQKELRPDWKQAVLGLSWIPLNYRHDVIRNIERVSAASEGAQIGTPEYLLELVRWYQQHDDAESANIVMKTVKELKLLQTPFVDENDRQQFLFHAEGRGEVGQDARNFTPGALIYCEQCKTNHRISDFGKMFHTRPTPSEGEICGHKSKHGLVCNIKKDHEEQHEYHSSAGLAASWPNEKKK